jgi:hypothetical protein
MTSQATTTTQLKGQTQSQPKIVDGGSLVSGGNKFDGTNDFLTFPDTFLNGSFAISTMALSKHGMTRVGTAMMLCRVLPQVSLRL